MLLEGESCVTFTASLAHQGPYQIQTPTYCKASWGFFGTKDVPQNDKGVKRVARGNSDQGIYGLRCVASVCSYYYKYFRFHHTFEPLVILRPFFGRRIPTLLHETTLNAAPGETV